MSRREFVMQLAHAPLVPLAPLALSATRVARGACAPFALRIGIIDGNDDARIDGAVLGVDEARHAAALFGGDVSLVRIAAGETMPRGLAAILGDADLARCESLLDHPALAATLFVNIACTADELRGAQCRHNAFHVAPSDAMRRDAIGETRETDGVATAWDASLERFGADTLNHRFRARFGRDMTESAWSAWFAVKALWESALRTKSADADRIAAYLVRDTTQFDGHKGRPISFRAWDHQLRQPLYVRAGAKLIEAPVATMADETSRDALDRLGTRRTESKCGIASQ